VLKKGVEKKQMAKNLCCIGAFIPYLWM